MANDPSLSTFARGAEYEREEIVHDSRGEPRTVIAKRTLYRANGKSHVVCSMSDVTELMRLQEIALQNEKHLRTFIEQLPVSVAMFDFRLRCLGASHAWLEQHGIQSPVIGEELQKVFPTLPESWKVAHRRALMGQVIRGEDDRAVALFWKEEEEQQEVEAASSCKASRRCQQGAS